MSSLLRSPVFHFLVLGFAAYLLYTGLMPENRETIHVTSQTIDALVQQSASITQSPVTPEQKKDLIEGYIEEEVLVREAYKRGFDKSDYRVRKRILGLMRTSLSEVIPEPSVAQLRVFYEENKGRYQTAPSISFEHVFFSFASDNLPTEPNQFIELLENSEDWGDLGDFSQVGNRFTKASFERTALTFGKPFAEAVFGQSHGSWEGPIESFIGVHFVRVKDAHEPELPSFESMESYLRTDYFMLKARQSQERKIQDLARNYRIVIDQPEAEK